MYKVLAVLLLVASVSFGAFTPPDAGVAIGNEAVTNTYNGVLNTNAVEDLIAVYVSTNGITSDITGNTLDITTNAASIVTINSTYVPLTSTNAIITKAVSTAGTAAAAAYTPITPSEREFSNGWKIKTSGTNLIFTYTAP